MDDWQESNRIELKRELTDTLEKEVVAFLNYRDGGLIYIGIDEGQVVGVSNADDIQLKIKDRIKNNISPSTMGLFDVITENYNGKIVIKITVASGSEKPYYLSKMGMSPKGCFLRVGSASEPMQTRMIENLFSSRTRNSIGLIRSKNQDLTFEQLRIYYSEKSFDLNNQFAKNLELLTPDGDFNYAAYLLSDINGTSIKVAKYDGLDRIKLIENEEYGYCCLVKATKAVLEKFKIENKTFARITPVKRDERKLLDPEALREAIINAIIHNDYSNEVTPKFELFNDRLEITSAGGLPDGFDENEFFQGYSVPRNKELMRVFRDLEMVEQLGSGVPRILAHYPRSSYIFTAHFVRLVLPFSGGFEEITAQVPRKYRASTAQDQQILEYCAIPRTAKEIMEHLGLVHRENFRKNILIPLIENGLLSLTIPNKPNSSKQRYVTSETIK